MSDNTLRITTVPCAPYDDQRMGTAGLRKKVRVFAQPHYLESFLQAVFDTLRLRDGASLVIGGDGRYHNDVAIQVIIRMAAAAGVRKIVVGREGLLSTPAASCLIRDLRADGGFLLTASHNPGGHDGDFGIKFNLASGGQAPPAVTDAVYRASRGITAYRIAELPPVPLGSCGVQQLGPLRLEVIDPVGAYEATMQRLFDFDLLSGWLRNGHRILFDAMHGVTGPYARRILGETLGAGQQSLLRATPLPDFGGLHPDPNPVDARLLVERCAAADAPDLGAASDGDGDRNMIVAPGFVLSPGDSVAMLLANATLAPGYRAGVPGAARSMPTSRALDEVARALGLPCYETPTGWRYFCNLLEAGHIGLCGEESFGTGSSHAREKDGLWAVLFWMNVVAARGQGLPEIARLHWERFGRHYFQRHDYEIADADAGERIMAGLRSATGSLRGRRLGGATVESADDFAYRDPVDGSETLHQGVRIALTDGCRMVFRLSGTGTAGATLRVYLEKHVRGEVTRDAAEVLAPLGHLAREVAAITSITGLHAPTMVV
jgi:phosphoglucomutase